MFNVECSVLAFAPGEDAYEFPHGKDSFANIVYAVENTIKRTEDGISALKDALAAPGAIVSAVEDTPAEVASTKAGH
jgi:hypothetical protein